MAQTMYKQRQWEEEEEREQENKHNISNRTCCSVSEEAKGNKPVCTYNFMLSILSLVILGAWLFFLLHKQKPDLGSWHY